MAPENILSGHFCKSVTVGFLKFINIYSVPTNCNAVPVRGIRFRNSRCVRFSHPGSGLSNNPVSGMQGSNRQKIYGRIWNNS
jgi:hypothetical protein